MKKLLFIILSLTFFVAISQVSFFQRKVSLNDGDSFIAPVYSDSIFSYYHSQEDSIAHIYTNRIDKSPLLSALVDDSMFVCLKQTIYDNSKGAYNDKRLSPVIWSTGNVYNELFNDFLHDMLKIKKVRDYAAELVTDILVDLCKIYPQDFKQRYIKDFTELLSFIKTIPDHKYKIVKESNYGYDLILYIDGEKNKALSMDMRGFILRRYLLDEIPLSDLERYIKQALIAIQATDVSSNPNIMYKANINSNSYYSISSTGNYYQIGKSNKICPYDYNYWKDKRTLYGDNPLEFGGSRLTCFSNEKETIYTIETGDQFDGKWEAAKNNIWINHIEGRTVVDSNGEIILSEQK